MSGPECRDEFETANSCTIPQGIDFTISQPRKYNSLDSNTVELDTDSTSESQYAAEESHSTATKDRSTERENCFGV